ncbi:hypothetical protein Taro_043489 [Colocasia esculenta]|uniref:Uncharacterized protein n=1 Tax=Colocasia esculenta TaxID=4460 RepID=A0A843WVY0_COLES|nr:hypothetical protein [Colocasia esculenta]
MFLGASPYGTSVCVSLTSWRVRGPGWFCLWALDLVEVSGGCVCGETFFSRVCSVLFVVTPAYLLPLFVGVLAALVGKGQVIPTEPCSQGSPPYFLQVGTRCRRSSLLDNCGGCWFHRELPAASVVSVRALVSCDLRVAFLQVLELFEFIAYLTGLNSNPSGFLNPWVATRPSGSLARVREVGSLQWYQSPRGSSVSSMRVLLLLLGARATSMVVWFAHAAVGFIVVLCIRAGVSRRLREATCGVAFTSAGSWSVEPVKGVLALLAVPLLLGCMPCWLCVWSLMFAHRCAQCSAQSASLLELSKCSMCRVTSLVEYYDTCLWLLSALCWLFVNSGEVLLKFFIVGSGGSEVSPESAYLPVVKVRDLEHVCGPLFDRHRSGVCFDCASVVLEGSCRRLVCGPLRLWRWLMVLMIVPCVVTYALIMSFVRRFTSLLSVGGV